MVLSRFQLSPNMPFQKPQAVFVVGFPGKLRVGDPDLFAECIVAEERGFVIGLVFIGSIFFIFVQRFIMNRIISCIFRIHFTERARTFSRKSA